MLQICRGGSDEEDLGSFIPGALKSARFPTKTQRCSDVHAHVRAGFDPGMNGAIARGSDNFQQSWPPFPQLRRTHGAGEGGVCHVSSGRVRGELGEPPLQVGKTRTGSSRQKPSEGRILRRATSKEKIQRLLSSSPLSFFALFLLLFLFLFPV